MSISNILPISIGNSDTNANFANILGQLVKVEASGYTRIYMVAKNGSGGTLAAGDVVVNSLTSGFKTGIVTTTTTPNDPDVCGMVPSEFGTSTIASNAYFLLLVDGPGRPKFAQTTITETAAGGASLGTGTTAGYCQLLIGTATGTAAATLADGAAYAIGVLGNATNTTAVTAAGQLGYAMIQCLE